MADQAALILSLSSATASSWPQVVQATADVIAGLPEQAVAGIHLLGTHLCWDPTEWRAELPAPPQLESALPLVAPVMRALREQQEEVVSFVLIGSPAVLDFADWAGRVRWAYIPVGEAAHGRPASQVEIFSPGHLSQLRDWLGRQAGFLPPTTPAQRGSVRQQWRLDRARYPMVLVEPLGAYVHIFPAAKPQFEMMLADAGLPGGPDQYLALLKLNPRVSPCDSMVRDYEQLFVTGLLPEEVEAWARWQGPGYSALNVEEWRATFAWLAEQPVSALPFRVECDADPLALQLWHRLGQELNPASFLDLSLMRHGVLEWVTGGGGQWLGMGQPRVKFRPNYHDARNDPPFVPTSLTQRSRYFGTRLLFR